MPSAVSDLALFTDDNGHPVAALGETRYGTLADLIQALPALKDPDQLVAYCQAVNHLKYGNDYRLIVDPAAYRARYEARLKAEPANEPFQGTAVRLRQFGVCDLLSLQPPRREGGTVVFFVEDDFLGIPYCVTAPNPDHPNDPVTYEPLPMTPQPEPAAE